MSHLQCPYQNIVLLGAPCSGKGTQASFISSLLSMTVLEMSSLLAQQSRNDVLEYVNSGELVPDDIVIDVVKKYLASLRGQGVILDGFPRTESQAVFLQTILNVDLVIRLDVPDSVLESRGKSRKVCNICNIALPLDVCPQCGDELVSRIDDSHIHKRLLNYKTREKVISAFYEDRMLVVDGELPVAEVSNIVQAKLLSTY